MREFENESEERKHERDKRQQRRYQESLPKKKDKIPGAKKKRVVLELLSFLFDFSS